MAVKRKAPVSYTRKTLEYLRGQGCHVEKVEHFNPHAGPHGVRHDAFGFMDLLVIDPEGKFIIGVQSTGPSGHPEHKRKILANEFAEEWLDCGGKIQLWSWRKLKEGNRLRWRPRIEEITLEMFE